MSELLGEKGVPSAGKGGGELKERIKEAIKRIHSGEDFDRVKEDFKDVLRKATPFEIARAEEELIKEGMDPREIHALCDVHLDLFREGVEEARLSVPEWHPLWVLMEEHNFFLNRMSDLRKTLSEAKNRGSATDGEREFLAEIKKMLENGESHYVREENVLFPLLEKHGITQPPAIMWMEHDKIRMLKKAALQILSEILSGDKEGGRNEMGPITKLEGQTRMLSDILSNHFMKENKILFPTAMNVLDPGEWVEARKEFDELGYFSITPVPMPEDVSQHMTPMGTSSGAGSAAAPAGGAQKNDKPEKRIDLDTGALLPEEIRAVLDALPLDISFVDRNDEVRYFNTPRDGRIFPRTRAVLGRKVQNCHPQKSVHVVEQILREFKEGTRDVAEFWINMRGRMIHIRYFPVRDRDGNYLGTLEVTQDITDIKKIEGEKRLLD